jgi:hypothetical protein
VADVSRTRGMTFGTSTTGQRTTEAQPDTAEAPADEAAGATETAPAVPTSERRAGRELWFDRVVGRRPERQLMLALILFAILMRGILFGTGFVQMQMNSAGSPNGPTPNVGATWNTFTQEYRNLRFADPDWYLDIAEHGYTHLKYNSVDPKKQYNWGFFPFWPIVVWAGSLLLGGRILLSGVLLANLLSLAAIPLLYKLFRLDWSPGIAFASVFALLCWPGAYHLMRPGNESLYLLLLVGSFYAARRERWWIAGPLAGLAAVTRPFGFLLLPALAYLFYRQWRQGKVKPVKALSLVAIPAALAIYLGYMRSITGDAFVYFHVQQKAWGQKGQFPFVPFIDWLGNPKLTSDTGWEFLPLSILLVCSVVAFCVAGGIMERRRQLRFPVEYWIFIVLNVFPAVATNKIGGGGRYMLVVFPVFALVVLVLRRRPALFGALMAGGLMLQVFLFANFIQKATWGG